MGEKKTLLNIGNGALVISEQGGDFELAVSKSAALGGGEASGVLAVEGEGKIVLKGKLAFDLGMKLLEAHSPAALVPIEQAANAMADAAVEKL